MKKRNKKKYTNNRQNAVKLRCTKIIQTIRIIYLTKQFWVVFCDIYMNEKLYIFSV